MMNSELFKLKEIVDFEIQVAKKNGFTPNLKNVTTLFERIGKSIKGIISADATPVGVVKAKPLLTSIRDVPFLVLADTVIYKPRGCRVTLNEYGSHIVDLCIVVSTLEDRLLIPFHNWVAKVISNPDELNKLHDLKQFDLVDTVKARKALAKVVNLESPITTGKYSDLIKRNREWSTVFNHNADMAKILKGKTVSALETKVTSLTKLTDALINEINNNANYKASPSSIEKLSELMYLLALEIEFSGLVISLANGYESMLENNIKAIKEITADK